MLGSQPVFPEMEMYTLHRTLGYDLNDISVQEAYVSFYKKKNYDQMFFDDAVVEDVLKRPKSFYFNNHTEYVKERNQFEFVKRRKEVEDLDKGSRAEARKTELKQAKRRLVLRRLFRKRKQNMKESYVRLYSRIKDEQEFNLNQAKSHRRKKRNLLELREQKIKNAQK